MSEEAKPPYDDRRERALAELAAIGAIASAADNLVEAKVAIVRLTHLIALMLTE